MRPQASTTMPTKRTPKAVGSAPARRGRPKGAGRIAARYSIVTTAEYRTWMSEFLGFLGESQVSDVFRDAVRAHAMTKGFRTPPAK